MPRKNVLKSTVYSSGSCTGSVLVAAHAMCKVGACSVHRACAQWREMVRADEFCFSSTVNVCVE